MVRDDFLEEIEDYSDLINFCNDNGIYDVLGDVCDDSEFCYLVDEDIRDSTRYDHWTDVRDWLNQLPTDSESGYYRRNGRLEYEELTARDFENDKRYILALAEEQGLFDDGISMAERYAQEEAELERLAQEAARMEQEADAQARAKLADFLGEEMIA